MKAVVLGSALGLASFLFVSVVPSGGAMVSQDFRRHLKLVIDCGRLWQRFSGAICCELDD